MKKLAIVVAGLLSIVVSFAQHSTDRHSTDRQKAEALLQQMTLDEKIGQMTQVTLGVVSTAQDGVLDPAALAKAVEEYKVGSLLNVTNHALTVDQWHTVITQIQDAAKKTRLKIPVIYGLDGIHGQTYTLDAHPIPPEHRDGRHQGSGDWRDRRHSKWLQAGAAAPRACAGILPRCWTAAGNPSGRGFRKPMEKMSI